jgi:hypothetical protein
MEQISTNLTWTNNSTKVGDNDGPAYVVYSNKGYSKASLVIEASKIQKNLVRRSDGKSVNAYLFLGIDVYDAETGEWSNCVDAGLGYIGGAGTFHAFVNRLRDENGNFCWWESPVELDQTHDFRIILDTSEEKGQLRLTVEDLTAGGVTVDMKQFPMVGTEPDGSNTAYYQDFAIDFPDDVCRDLNGKESKDWDQVVAYNTDEGLCLKNIHVSDATLYNSSGSFLWTEDLTEDRFLWPYRTRKVDYVCTKVTAVKKDCETIIDLDMNR